MSFSDVVEAIKELSIEEKQQIQLLLKQYVREERRAEMHNNFQAALVEEKKGELEFSSNLNKLRHLIYR